MPRVALVYPYFRTRSATEILLPPLGAASLKSQLRQLGVETRIFDCTFTSLKKIEKEIISFLPDITGIYSIITMSLNAFKIADLVRAKIPQSLIVAGGPMPTLFPKQYSTPCDAVFRGESDLSFPSFCRDYLDQGISRERLSRLPLDTYPGLYIQNASVNIDNPTTHYSEKSLQSFPLPDRSDFNHAAYQRAWYKSTGTKTTSIIMTFGCPFNCDFCSRPIFGNRFRHRNLEAIVEEIDQIQRFGYDSLWIADDNFTLSFHFLREFCQYIADRRIKWSCLSRTTGVNKAMAEVMKESGCIRVYLGLESGNQATLNLMNKQATLEENINTVHVFKEAGIEVAAFFIVGYPGETIESIEETFQLALTLPLDYISFNVPFPLPGSSLFDRVNNVDINKEWTKENEVTFVYSSEFDPHWLRSKIRQTMKIFGEKKQS